MELIKEIVFKDPPTKWTLQYKKEKFDKEGKKITHQDFYLTANLFYADRTSYHLTSKIIQECKEYLKREIKFIPELEKCKIEIEYRHTKEIDLDNKAYFWIKLFLDILKTPSKKQVQNANLKGKKIITLNAIFDDTTKYIDSINMSFQKGEHCMIIRVFGRVKNEQKEMDLFFK